MEYNGNLKETYDSMTIEDKKYAMDNDFEGMKDEIDQIMQKFVDDIYFKHANAEDIAIIDATMTTIHDIASSGSKLIKEMHENKG